MSTFPLGLNSAEGISLIADVLCEEAIRCQEEGLHFQQVDDLDRAVDLYLKGRKIWQLIEQLEAKLGESHRLEKCKLV